MRTQTMFAYIAHTGRALCASARVPVQYNEAVFINARVRQSFGAMLAQWRRSAATRAGRAVSASASAAVLRLRCCLLVGGSRGGCGTVRSEVVR